MKCLARQFRQFLEQSLQEKVPEGSRGPGALTRLGERGGSVRVTNLSSVRVHYDALARVCSHCFLDSTISLVLPSKQWRRYLVAPLYLFHRDLDKHTAVEHMLIVNHLRRGAERWNR